jgi:AcrR family transcriptional regulator
MSAKSRTNRPERPRRGPGRPRAAERIPEGARNRLLEAAVEVFARRGYERATVDEIAAAARLSKGTLYWHFASKADLFQALLEERFDRPVDAVMDITRTAPAEEPSAPAVDAALAHLFAAEPRLVHLMQEYWAAAARDPKMRKRYVRRQEKLRAALAETVRIRQERLGVPFAVEPEHLAVAFLALATGLAMEAEVDPAGVPAGLFGEVLALMYDGNAARFGRLPDAS